MKHNTIKIVLFLGAICLPLFAYSDDELGVKIAQGCTALAYFLPLSPAEVDSFKHDPNLSGTFTESDSPYFLIQCTFSKKGGVTPGCNCMHGEDTMHVNVILEGDTLKYFVGATKKSVKNNKK